jgi:hypothetical protein
VTDKIDIGQGPRASSFCPIADHAADPIGCELLLLAGHLDWRTAFNGRAFSVQGGRVEPIDIGARCIPATESITGEIF